MFLLGADEIGISKTDSEMIVVLSYQVVHIDFGLYPKRKPNSTAMALNLCSMTIFLVQFPTDVGSKGSREYPLKESISNTRRGRPFHTGIQVEDLYNFSVNMYFSKTGFISLVVSYYPVFQILLTEFMVI